jgi:hypothetical protein
MAEKRPRDRVPGNDGRWFLELVGVVEPDPASTDTYAALQRLVPPPTSDDTATISATSVASTANGGLETDPSPRGAPPGPDESAEPRSRGWWVLGVVVLLIAAAAVAGVLLLPRAADAEAASIAADHRSALVALRNELPATQAALADLTDPAASSEAVAAAVPAALGDLNAVSGRVIAVAAAPLPSTLPLVPRDRFDALAPTRAAAVVLAGRAHDLAGELGVGYTYRSSIESLFAIGPLPVQLGEADIAELSIELAGDLADTGRIVAELPFEPRFATVHELATTTSERYVTWQLEYLDALHEKDAVRAESLIVELAGAVDQLRAARDEALGSLRTDLDAEILQLAAELETAIGAVP